MRRRDASGIRRRFHRLLQRAAAAAVAAGEGAHLPGLSVELPVGDLDPLAWLQAQHAAVRVYWADRRGAEVYAGVQAADIIRAPRAAPRPAPVVRRVLAGVQGGNLRYFGGLAFSPAAAARPPWTSLGAAAFVLPRFTAVRRDDGCTVSCNLPTALPRDRLRAIATCRRQLAHIIFAPAAAARRVEAAAKTVYVPDADGWAARVAEALRAIADGQVGKVVLAAEARLGFSRPPSPTAALARLRQSTTDCYVFCFQLRPGLAFMGASPERLYRRQGRRLTTEAVAGTRHRHRDDRKDAALAAELLASGKDRRELEFVSASLQTALRSLAANVTRSAAPRVLQLARLQHLYEPWAGDLLDGIDDARLLADLHPTPAVGGYPRAAALRLIRRLEASPRGWYAGPVGWLTEHEAEFAVAIRSVLVRPRRVSIYAGAGLVAGSRAADEWREVNAKRAELVGIFGGGS